MDRAGNVMWLERPAAMVAKLCGQARPLPEGWRYYGCAAVYPRQWCVVIVASDLRGEVRHLTRRHEIAHCGGWVHQ